MQNIMSRIGKKIILIPDKVEVKIEKNNIFVKGPLGEINRRFSDKIKIEINNKKITLTPAKDNEENKALWGTCSSHLLNMVNGVTNGFEKKLMIEGVGFKAQLEGQKISLSLGYSHPVKIDIPEGIKVQIEKNTINISGIDKDKVGSFTSVIRSTKKPEPYKGKGIRYIDEIIKKKTGKKAATTAA